MSRVERAREDEVAVRRPERLDLLVAQEIIERQDPRRVVAVPADGRVAATSPFTARPTANATAPRPRVPLSSLLLSGGLGGLGGAGGAGGGVLAEAQVQQPVCGARSSLRAFALAPRAFLPRHTRSSI